MTPDLSTCAPDLRTERENGFTSWQDVTDALHGDWLALDDDARGRGVLHLDDQLVVLDRPGLLRARERRGLHRSGFRELQGDGTSVWRWQLPARTADRKDFAAAVREEVAGFGLLREQAVRTMRDVLRSDVRDVAVLLLLEQEEPWDEDWDEEPDDDDVGGPECPCCGCWCECTG